MPTEVNEDATRQMAEARRKQRVLLIAQNDGKTRFLVNAGTGMTDWETYRKGAESCDRSDIKQLTNELKLGALTLSQWEDKVKDVIKNTSVSYAAELGKGEHPESWIYEKATDLMTPRLEILTKICDRVTSGKLEINSRQFGDEAGRLARIS